MTVLERKDKFGFFRRINLSAFCPFQLGPGFYYSGWNLSFCLGVHVKIRLFSAQSSKGRRVMAATAEQLKLADFSVLVIAVMGETLAMNIDYHGFSVTLCNLRSDR